MPLALKPPGKKESAREERTKSEGRKKEEEAAPKSSALVMAVVVSHNRGSKIGMRPSSFGRYYRNLLCRITVGWFVALPA